MNIEVNHVYRAKKPKKVFDAYGVFYNDRMVVHVTETRVQYDSSTVRDGRKYPMVDRDKFEAWAGEDVTAGYPAGDWAVWK